MQEYLEAMVRRLNDIHEIQNLMGRYEFLTTANMFTETVELFAKTVPQKIEIGPLGVWDGMDAAYRCFHGFHNWTSKVGVPIEGQMMQHTLATPVIEVAKDGKTAKGVWMSPGHEARVLGGKLTAMWVWGTYGEDFIKEDGAVEDPQPPRLPEHHHPVRGAVDGAARRRPRRHRRHLPARPARRIQAEPAQHLRLDVLAVGGDGARAGAAGAARHLRSRHRLHQVARTEAFR